MNVGDKVIYCQFIHGIFVPVEVDTIDEITCERNFMTSRGWYELCCDSSPSRFKAKGSNRFKPYAHGFILAYSDKLWADKAVLEAEAARRGAEHAAGVLRAAEYAPKLAKIRQMAIALSNRTTLSPQHCEAINAALDELSGVIQ